MSQTQKFIRASELGEYTFCARAWWLRRVEGHEATSGHEARRAGDEWHLKHGRAVARVRALQRLALLTTLLAIVLAVIILLVWWRG
jgi:CRISPR/Cas system-associated exonuclease Cas4 (RecB family)